MVIMSLRMCYVKNVSGHRGIAVNCVIELFKYKNKEQKNNEELVKALSYRLIRSHWTSWRQPKH